MYSDTKFLLKVLGYLGALLSGRGLWHLPVLPPYSYATAVVPTTNSPIIIQLRVTAYSGILFGRVKLVNCILCTC